MRSDGRLPYVEFLPYDVRYPIILPLQNLVTKLIVKYHHKLGNHWSADFIHLVLDCFNMRGDKRECTMCKRRKA